MDNSDHIKCSNCGKSNYFELTECKYCHYLLNKRPANREFQFKSLQPQVHERIGGLLILFAISIYLSPILSILSAIYYSMIMGSMSAIPKLEVYGKPPVPWDLTPAFYWEVAVATIVSVYSVLLVRPFHQKSKTLPRKMIIFILLTMVCSLVDFYLIQQSVTVEIKSIAGIYVPQAGSLSEHYDRVSPDLLKFVLQSSLTSLSISVGTGFFSILYLLIADRVRYTFVN